MSTSAAGTLSSHDLTGFVCRGGVQQQAARWGVQPSNALAAVEALLVALRATGAEFVRLQDGRGVLLYEALMHDYAIGRAEESLLRLLARCCEDAGDEQALLAVLGDEIAMSDLAGLALTDVLAVFPSARPPLAEFLGALVPLQRPQHLYGQN